MTIDDAIATLTAAGCTVDQISPMSGLYLIDSVLVLPTDKMIAFAEIVARADRDYPNEDERLAFDTSWMD